jgi:hypothetical protein
MMLQTSSSSKGPGCAEDGPALLPRSRPRHVSTFTARSKVSTSSASQCCAIVGANRLHKDANARLAPPADKLSCSALMQYRNSRGTSGTSNSGASRAEPANQGEYFRNNVHAVYCSFGSDGLSGMLLRICRRQMRPLELLTCQRKPKETVD